MANLLLISVLRSFAKFTGKYLCQSLFLNKVAGPATLLKKRLWHRCFPVNFAKFLRAALLQKISGRLLLDEGLSILYCQKEKDFISYTALCLILKISDLCNLFIL